ncbi:Protein TRIGALACTOSYLDIACYLGLYCEROL 3 [Hibiscus syriacus]|uniref:Protein TRIGALACTOSYLDIACYLGLYCEROL 3 n=1 Tax=Hibiscus syriacus TaxID=106335 RepID=A0A6A2Z5N1_HIBSY|nr:Protein TRIGALACTOSYLDIACYLGLYCEROL 3 [Hibiscus syriacus]
MARVIFSSSLLGSFPVVTSTKACDLGKESSKFCCFNEKEEQRNVIRESSKSGNFNKEVKHENDSDVFIECRNVYKSFGEKHILQGVSFKIRHGEAVGIIGPSGTGKPTILKIIAGLLAPDEGVERLPSELSGGMKKRVTLARSIICDITKESIEPEVLLYDEPIVGLDPIVSKVVEDLILDPVPSTVVEDLIHSVHTKGEVVPGKQGKITSYVVVTHQHSTILRAVDRLLFLHEGKLVWHGMTDEFTTSTNPIIRQFSPMFLGPFRSLEVLVSYAYKHRGRLLYRSNSALTTKSEPLERGRTASYKRVYKRSRERRHWFENDQIVIHGEEEALERLKMKDLDPNSVLPVSAVAEVNMEGCAESTLERQIVDSSFVNMCEGWLSEGDNSDFSSKTSNRRAKRLLIRDALDKVSTTIVSSSAFAVLLEEALFTWAISKLLRVSFKDGKSTFLEKNIKLEEDLRLV